MTDEILLALALCNEAQEYDPTRCCWCGEILARNAEGQFIVEVSDGEYGEIEESYYCESSPGDRHGRDTPHRPGWRDFLILQERQELLFEMLNKNSEVRAGLKSEKIKAGAETFNAMQDEWVGSASRSEERRVGKECPV